MSVWKRLFVLLSLAFPWLLATGVARAEGVTEIRIVHATGRIFVVESGRLRTPEGYPLEVGPTIDVLKGDEVHLSIIDPDPVLFDYKLEKLAPVTTADQKALQDLATSFGALISSLDQNQKTVKALMALPKDKQTLSAAAVVSCNTSIPALDAFLAVVKGVEKARGESQTVIQNSLNQPDLAKSMVRAWNLPMLQTDLTKAREDLNNAADNLLKIGNPDPCAGLVSLAQGRSHDVQNTLDDLKALADLVEKIGTPLNLPAFTVKITENQPVKVTIARSKNFPASLAGDNRFVGDRTITIIPRSRVGISVSPAMVYSFVRNPSYDTEEKGGQIFIRQKDDPYKKLDLAAMLELEPTAWDLGPVNLGVQLGVSPKSDLGLFLGLSLRATNLFTFGGGVAYQKVTRLQQGLSPNQVIPSKDLLKTEDAFATGLYLHLTVSLPKMN